MKTWKKVLVGIVAIVVIVAAFGIVDWIVKDTVVVSYEEISADITKLDKEWKKFEEDLFKEVEPSKGLVGKFKKWWSDNIWYLPELEMDKAIPDDLLESYNKYMEKRDELERRLRTWQLLHAW